MSGNRKVHLLQMKALCIKFAAEHDYQIVECTDDGILLEDPSTIIDVPFDHVLNQFDQGHLVEDTLMNEASLKPSGVKL